MSLRGIAIISRGEGERRSHAGREEEAEQEEAFEERR
jgi:hypothetical protein